MQHTSQQQSQRQKSSMTASSSSSLSGLSNWPQVVVVVVRQLMLPFFKTPVMEQIQQLGLALVVMEVVV
jgi:hypothetical protein